MVSVKNVVGAGIINGNQNNTKFNMQSYNRKKNEKGK